MRTKASLLAFGLLFLASCGLSIQSKQLIATAAITAKERAVTFVTLSRVLGAKDAKEEETAQKFIASHRDGLISDAKALGDLAQAVALKNGFSKQAKTALKMICEAARARAGNWDAAKGLLMARGVSPEEWTVLSETHSQSLNALTQVYDALYDSVKDKEKE